MDPEAAFNYQFADSDNNVLRKMLGRLNHGLTVQAISIGSVTVDGPLDVKQISGDDWLIHGTVAVSNFPATQAVSGSVAVSNFPASQTVNGAVSVAGTVAVSNFPATQPVSGSVTATVSNFPATQPVSGSVTATVSNFPATQPVSGSVSVSNFPASQSVVVSNFPASQVVSGTVAISNPDTFSPEWDAQTTGFINGKSAVIRSVVGRRAGFNSTSTLQDIGEWLGTSLDSITDLAGTELLEVLSTSANDTLAGTGCQVLRIFSLDANLDEQVTEVNMNGTTPVSLGAVRMSGIWWMEAKTVGSGGVAAGNISLRQVTTNVIHERITAGGNKSMTGRFRVPRNKTAYILDWEVESIGSATQDARLRVQTTTDDPSVASNAYHFWNIALQATGASFRDDIFYTKVPAGTRMKFSTISGSAAAANVIDTSCHVLVVAN